MLNQRIITALVMAFFAVIAVLILPSAYFAIFIGALCLLAIWEWTRLLGFSALNVRVLVVTINAVLFVLLWGVRETPIWWAVISLGIVWWLVALGWLRHFSFAASPTRQNRFLKLIAGLLTIIPAWAALMDIHRHSHLGHAWALFALVLVWTADVSAYFAGSRYGTTKLAPRISPGKTIAGVWGAFIGSGIIALTGGWLFGARGFALVALLLLSLVSVAFSIIGDLFESLIKRHSNVKDSGTLFPGHGGLFDRLDSVFAAVPVLAAGMALFDLYTSP